MRKNVFGRKLQRDINERKALFNSLMRELVIRERIQTTEAKAKAIKADVEKAVTKAKKNPILAKQRLQAYFGMPVVKKLVDEITPRFSKRQGGYTRIIHIGSRLNDNAKMVILEWTEKDRRLVPVKSELEIKDQKRVIADQIEVSSSKTENTEIIDAEIVADTKEKLAESPKQSKTKIPKIKKAESKNRTKGIKD